jgi:hypothetical protein
VPVTPVDKGRPVALVRVRDVGVPSAPLKVVKAPAEPMLTPKAVATPVPSPEIPVETGRPVALVKVTEVGVPNIGVTKVGEVESTTEPDPVVAVILSVPSLPEVVTIPLEVKLVNLVIETLPRVAVQLALDPSVVKNLPPLPV